MIDELFKLSQQFLEIKNQGLSKPAYEDIIMPKNTAAGIYMAGFAFLLGFAFVWEIVWLAIASVVGIIVVFVVRGFNEHPEYVLKAEEVREREEIRLKKAQTAPVGNPDDEDMGLIELIKVVLAFALSVIRKKRRAV